MRTKEFGPMLKTFANSLVALSFQQTLRAFIFISKWPVPVCNQLGVTGKFWPKLSIWWKTLCDDRKINTLWETPSAFAMNFFSGRCLIQRIRTNYIVGAVPLNQWIATYFQTFTYAWQFLRIFQQVLGIFIKSEHDEVSYLFKTIKRTT